MPLAAAPYRASGLVHWRKADVSRIKRPRRHFCRKTLKHVSAEMALHVLAPNMKRVMSILGVGGLMEALRT
jgi:hypothetical protein